MKAKRFQPKIRLPVGKETGRWRNYAPLWSETENREIASLDSDMSHEDIGTPDKNKVSALRSANQAEHS